MMHRSSVKNSFSVVNWSSMVYDWSSVMNSLSMVHWNSMVYDWDSVMYCSRI